MGSFCVILSAVGLIFGVTDRMARRKARSALLFCDRPDRWGQWA